MNTAVQTLPVGSVNTKPLWAAVSVLGVAVLALGASLIYVQTRPVDGHIALANLAQPVLSAADSSVETATDDALPVTAVARDEVVMPAKPSARPAPIRPKPAQQVAVAPVLPARPAAMPAPVRAAPAVVIATAPAANPGYAPVVITEYGPVASRPVYQTPRSVCASCGRVEAVSAIERTRSGAGVGAVAGGVLGAVVGNQIGKGSGRTIATILGAVGGGVAGNTIEKNMNREIVYRVQVRMDDGSIRTLEQTSAPQIGMAVIVEGDNLRRADGSAASATPAPRQMAPQAKVYSTDRV